MPHPDLEAFGKILVQQVRDEAIKGSDSNLRLDVKHIISKRWQEAGRGGDLDSIARALIPDVVDETLAQLLRLIDQELLQLKFVGPGGTTLDLPKDGRGELEGWYMGSWREAYSKQRCRDDFSET
jgi:hypothetical protein